MPEETVMMVPLPRAIRCGVNASMTRMVPRRFGADRLLGGAEVRRVAQVLGDHHPGHRHDRVQTRMAAQDRVAGAGDAGGVGHIDLNGSEPVGDDIDNPRFVELAGELALSSERFRALWARHDVRNPDGGTTTVEPGGPPQRTKKGGPVPLHFNL